MVNTKNFLNDYGWALGIATLVGGVITYFDHTWWSTVIAAMLVLLGAGILWNVAKSWTNSPDRLFLLICAALLASGWWWGGHMVPGQPAANMPKNYLHNPSFEQDTLGWTPFPITTAIQRSNKHHGQGGFSGCSSSSRTNGKEWSGMQLKDPPKVNPGDYVVFSAWVLTQDNTNHTQAVQPHMRITFIDAQGKEIHDVTAMQMMQVQPVWYEWRTGATAPNGAVSFRAAIAHGFDGEQSIATSAICVDEARLTIESSQTPT